MATRPVAPATPNTTNGARRSSCRDVEVISLASVEEFTGSMSMPDMRATDRGGGYFVTGGTGFIGRHLITRLLEHSGAPIFVLVRPQSMARFERRLARWDEAAGRVHPVAGDLTAHRLELTARQLDALEGRIGHLFHVGGLYDLTAGAEALERVNVRGTAHTLEVAERLGVACFHHVSSIAVAGRYRGTFREDMFAEAGDLDDPYFRTKHEAERLVRTACPTPWRIYRPSLVVGHSVTGEIDKADGPYYLFPLFERLAALLPAFLPLPGIEGGLLNLVPVDYVAAAIDRIAHLSGLDGKTFHLVDPTPRTLGQTLDVFAEAAGSPRFSLRVPAIGALATAALGAVAGDGSGIAGRVLGLTLGLPPRALAYVDNRATFDSRQTQAALAGSGIEPPPLESYSRPLWSYWERNLYSDTSHGRALEDAVRGKRVLVTGASSGIGRATALKLGAAGAHVLLVARRPERLDEVRALVERGGGTAESFPVDLTDAASVEALCRRLANEGGVDVVVNNAGRSIRRSLHLSEGRFHDFQRTMEINYFATVRLILLLLPVLRRHGAHIVNVSSMGVQIGAPRFSAYVASKAAVDAFSRCAAPELLADGIDITTVYMPLVKTDMIAPTQLYDAFSAITPAQAADMICSAVVRRPKTVSTFLGLMGQAGSSLAPRAFDLWLHVAYRLFPDSAAARGEVAERDDQTGSLGRLFARLLPGVHW